MIKTKTTGWLTASGFLDVRWCGRKAG